VDLHKISVEPSHVVICRGTCAEIIKADGVSGAPKTREKFFSLGKIVHCGRLGEFEQQLTTSVTQSTSNVQQCFAEAFVLYRSSRYVDRHTGFVAAHDRLDGATAHDEVKFDD